MDRGLHTYFQRQLLLPEMDQGGFEKLRNAKVLVVGAGGLGCPVLEQLVGSGVGTIGIVDNDVVNYSNLHRQSLYTEEEVGEYKVFCASRRLLKRNEHCKINVYPQQLRPENALQMISAYDIVIDCSDNYSTRYLINDACVMLDQPFVYGAIYRFQGQVALFNNNEGITYRCFLPQFPSSESATDCVNSGVITGIPSLVGNLQALETIKWILGEQTLEDEMLVIDFKKLSFNTLKLGRRSADYDFLENGLHHSYYQKDCKLSFELNVDEVTRLLAENEIDRIVDVREADEITMEQREAVEHLPLSKMRECLSSELSGNILFYCKTGKRSREAAQIAANSGEGKYYSLKGEMTTELLEKWKNRK